VSSQHSHPAAALRALKLLESLPNSSKLSPEATYFFARARAQAEQPYEVGFDTAIKCEGFATALSFGAAQAAKHRRFDEAAALAQRARAVAPSFSKPLLIQAVLQFQQGRVDAALKIINAFLDEQPDSSDGHYALGLMRLSKASAVASLDQKEDAQKLHDAARNAFCTAAAMGHLKAKDMCRDTSQ
jgi:tetratricopeptide (TPR) repeat protein